MKLKYNVGRWGLGWTYFHLRYLQNHREFTQENYWNHHKVLPASLKLRIYLCPSLYFILEMAAFILRNKHHRGTRGWGYSSCLL